MSSGLDVRVETLEKGFDRMSHAVESIADNLTVLTRLEERHEQTRESLTRAFSSLESQDARIKLVEIEMPMLKMVRGWVITGVLGILGLLGVAIIHLVMK